MAKPYILDADVFIQAKNLYYRFEFAAGFWGWIQHAYAADLVFSIKKVRSQLIDARKGDKVKIWAQNIASDFFLDDVRDRKVMSEYQAVVAAVFGVPRYTQEAKNEFMQQRNADAFLIAAAKRHGAKLVTHEGSQPDSKARVMIPDAAALVGVQTISIFDLLSRNAGSDFKFKS